jgi:hypothetical protein
LFHARAWSRQSLPERLKMFRATVARWQTRTGRWLHAYLAFAAISLLLLSLWLAYDAGRSVNTDLTLAEHTRAVQHGAETLLSTLRDVEIG